MIRPPRRYDFSMDFQSKSDVIAAYVRDLIITGQVEANSPLRQRDLAERFGVSPTPVREALRRLEAEGLVKYDLHRGATVIDGSFAPNEENYWVRAVLEPFAARLAATRVTDEELAALDALHEQLCREPETGGSINTDAAYHGLNRSFHFGIYEAARSPLLLALIRLLWQSFPLGPATVQSREDSLACHEAILEALHRHDADAAELHTRRHILEAGGYDVHDPRLTVGNLPPLAQTL
jgi:DNA-binding GntR family transcriptional regulator